MKIYHPLFSKQGITILLFILIGQLVFSQEPFPFQNPDLDREQRIDDMIGRLSIDEKASLLLYNSPAIERLDIPAYNWWNESLHGVARAGKATVFPQAIGLAATFDEELIFRIATAISDEARAKYNAAVLKGSRQQYQGLTFWSPNINIFRDPRWGRGQETWGEDPVLTSTMGAAYVKGLQGNDPGYLKAAACAKHFVVHSGPEKTRHSFNALPNEVDFNETYLPAFKALVNEGVETVMCAYNQLYGEPCCGNTMLLSDLLLKKWGFKGHIVSDCWALTDFYNFQTTVDNATDAAALAVKAGVNLNCGVVYQQIPQALEEGKINEKEIDDLLKTLLRTRFKLGLMDAEDNSPWAKISEDVVNCPKHRQLAREAAAKSVVLLKNNNNTLPLNLDDLYKIYVTGPTAADNLVLMGNYNGLSGNMVTILEGIVNAVDAGTVVEYSQGALLNTDSIYHGIYHAESSDAIIACIGNSRMLEGEEGDAMLSDHGGDRLDIRLPENQIEFIRKLRQNAPDKPLIAVITGGSAIAIPEIEKLADAILFAWYPGEQGGNALADILFGLANPSGRLPVTFYAGLDDLPAFDDYSMKNRTYKYFHGTPLYAFGHGLSYTTFEYSDMLNNKTSFGSEDEIEIKCTIKNTGIKDGDEVVQLYVTKPAFHENDPIKSLVGFRRVSLKIGESKEVSFLIKIKDLAVWNIKANEFTVIPGEYIFLTGSSSSNIKLKTLIKLE
ncbi:MAG: glycoside hydrolase family 3 C-terminal domain-containing protein [Bacteroidales bacterium]|nr:glycoside hydrolase family 3 C-terminal domain-containing protein [Bacteroidales bacterium]